MIWLILFLVLPTAILFATFQRALLRREPLVLLVAFVADVLANYGLLLLLFLFGKPMAWPKWGEWTFSKRLPSLMRLPGWRGWAAATCKLYINSKVPGHIPD